MNETLIQQQVEQLKFKIKQKVRHRTLHKYTGEPVVRDDRLFFLLLPFLNGEQWTEEHEQAGIAVAIIYSALFAHDQIKESNASSKSQQLTVLAGDYYSGMYYQILAKQSNIDLIRSLSNGIIEISEKKATVYDQVHRTFNEWMSTIVSIESLLIEQYYQHYQFEHYIPYMRQALFINRIANELELLNVGKLSRFQESLIESAEFLGYSSDLRNLLENVCNEGIAHLIKDIEGSTVLSKPIKVFMCRLINDYINKNAVVLKER
ncbi:MAG: heptaprenyl diphosphate synthase component 1 [Paenisporosarcina sp.]